MLVYSNVYSVNFAVIGDPHISQDPCEINRLDYVIKYLNENNSTLNLKFIVIIGDLATGSKNAINTAMQIIHMSELGSNFIPIFPMVGDNEYQDHLYDEYFNEMNTSWGKTLNPHPTILNNFQNAMKAVIEYDPPLDNLGNAPQCGATKPKLNYRFSCDGVVFAGVDFCTNASEGGDLRQTGLDFLESAWEYARNLRTTPEKYMLFSTSYDDKRWPNTISGRYDPNSPAVYVRQISLGYYLLPLDNPNPSIAQEFNNQIKY